ncbi:MAG: nucleoside recognition domain protein [Nevskia sp.]|nr:nucleoside recognition domain protein [Nevskia sp.]
MVLNFVWLSMFFLAGAFGLLRWLDGADPIVFEEMTKALFDSAQSAVMLLIGLAGSLIFWMGLLKIAEAAGAVQRVARLMSPLLRRVFPGLPMEHPAAGAMVLNFAANALGIDNAATPTGLKAMRELQTLNPTPDVATNHQVMFMVLHAASLTLFPIGIIALRAAAGAAQPADVFLPILFASLCSALGGFLAVAIVQRLRLADPWLLAMLALAILVPGIALWALSRLPAAQMQTLSSQLAGALLFAAILWFLGLAAWKRVDAWSAFIEGAREGLASTIQIAPYLVAMLVAIGVLRASGGLDEIVGGLWSMLSWTGLPAQTADALPTMLMKPLSGSGARGLMVETMHSFGADSFAGRLACLFQGGTDTTFYVISLYSGAAGLKRLRHTLPCALIADLAGFVGALAIAVLLFR